MLKLIYECLMLMLMQCKWNYASLTPRVLHNSHHQQWRTRGHYVTYSLYDHWPARWFAASPAGTEWDVTTRWQRRGVASAANRRPAWSRPCHNLQCRRDPHKGEERFDGPGSLRLLRSSPSFSLCNLLFPFVYKRGSRTSLEAVVHHSTWL